MSIGVVVDGNSILYSVFHALNYRQRGIVTEGLLAFTWVKNLHHKLTRQLDLQDAAKLYVTWDLRGSSEPRKALWPTYKQGRTPNELVHKTKDILIDKLRFIAPRLSMGASDAEADDLIAILVGETLHDQWIILSGDKDNMQHISHNVTYYDIGKKTLLDHDGFLAKNGFAPDELPMQKALVGDPSDNWPGVKGIGTVTFKRLLKAYGRNHIQDALTDEQKTIFKLGIILCSTPFCSDSLYKNSCISKWRENMLADINSSEAGDAQPLIDAFDFVSTTELQTLCRF